MIASDRPHSELRLGSSIIILRPLGLFCYFPDYFLSYIPLVPAQYQKAQVASLCAKNEDE